MSTPVAIAIIISSIVVFGIATVKELITDFKGASKEVIVASVIYAALFAAGAILHKGPESYISAGLVFAATFTLMYLAGKQKLFSRLEAVIPEAWFFCLLVIMNILSSIMPDKFNLAGVAVMFIVADLFALLMFFSVSTYKAKK